MLKNILYEEDMFPRFFTGMSTREYGYLFYDAANKESFDSNHALIYQQKISCLESVLKDIISFYDGLGITHISTKPLRMKDTLAKIVSYSKYMDLEYGMKAQINLWY